MLIWKIIKDVFLNFYDSLFFYIGLSILWFLLVSPIIFLAINAFAAEQILIYFLLPVILLGPFILSGLKLVNRRYCKETAKLRQFLTGIPSSFLPGLAGIFYGGAIYIILFIALNFYLARLEESFLMVILTALVAYFIIFFTITQMFFWGLTAVRGTIGFKQRVKYSLLIPLDNIIQATLWFLVQMAISGLLFVVLPGIPILFFSFSSLLIIIGTRKLVAPYLDADFAQESQETQES